MFKRREKQKWTTKIRNFLWPKLGVFRLMQYNSLRVGRIADTPYRIAAGLACGVFVSFTPFIGFHVILAIVIAYIIRANMFASVVGTIVGNPWTFPFIWAVIYNVGARFQGHDQVSKFSEMIDGDKLLTHPVDALEPVLFPMIHGGILVGLPVAWVSYFIFKYFIISYREKRKSRRHKRMIAQEEHARVLEEAEEELYDPKHERHEYDEMDISETLEIDEEDDRNG